MIISTYSKLEEHATMPVRQTVRIFDSLLEERFRLLSLASLRIHVGKSADGFVPHVGDLRISLALVPLKIKMSF